jgi:acetolactate synthase-1/2/3 large subunit
MDQHRRTPVILAGGGVIACGAYQELRALADKYRIPVTMSTPGMGAYPSDAPLSLGLVAMPAASMPTWQCTSPIF